ncbi:MAG: S41 family peptidase [Planctomycetes bacterium]|nr:S41 family peptidase [Planctomycetota bacterium]
MSNSTSPHPAARRFALVALLIPLLSALPSTPARGQDVPPVLNPQPVLKPQGAQAHLEVLTQPGEASVYVRYTVEGAEKERYLGQTGAKEPLSVELEVGSAELVIFKDGYVCRVEAFKLTPGGSARLEVRLSPDVAIPHRLRLKRLRSFVRTASESEELYVSTLAKVVGLHVEKVDPYELIDASTKSLVDVLTAIRSREQILRRELSPAARKRYYGEEIDLRSYPALRLTRTVDKDGIGKFELAAGGRAIRGETEKGVLDTYLHMLWKVYRFLDEEWDRDGRVSHSMLARIAIEGQLSALKDEHTHFLGPDDLEEMGTEREGEFGGVGIVVALREGRLTVIAPMEGSPGLRAGMLPGDWIIAIDGAATSQLTMADCVERMRGKVDSPVELTIRRAERTLTLTILRAKVKIKHIAHRLLSPSIGYLRISSFMSDGLSKAVEKALTALQKQGARALVIDLRNNPGGLLPEAHRISDLFVPKGKIVSTRSRLGEEQVLIADPKRTKFRLPIAILINGGSASASEILAGTLREHELATLVGTKTFGKGSVQRILPLDPFPCGLALTVATYHLPSGKTPHKLGIKPDHEVTLTEAQALTLLTRTNYSWDAKRAQEDPQLRKAVQLLESKLKD